MHIPLWSIVTLVTELFVTLGVCSIIGHAYRTGVFWRKLAFGVLAYEILFNISYMLSRLLAGTHEGTPQILTPYETGLAIFHGVFSLIMFATLVWFFVVAHLRYARGENFFRAHPVFTGVFLTAWFVSVLSGICFFVSLYFF